MTRSDVSGNYQRWLVGGETHAAIIETIEIMHDNLSPSWYLANWDRNFTATLSDQGTATQQFTAARFELEPNAVEDNLTQQSSLVISSLDGILYDVLADMTKNQRNKPITIRVRLYMHDDLSSVLIDPPPVWTVHSVTANYDALRLELNSMALRTNRIGRYYTQLEFPVLVYQS